MSTQTVPAQFEKTVGDKNLANHLWRTPLKELGWSTPQEIWEAGSTPMGLFRKEEKRELNINGDGYEASIDWDGAPLGIVERRTRLLRIIKDCLPKHLSTLISSPFLENSESALASFTSS